MEIKAVFFDLDGTLLPMDQDEFVKVYFGLLAGRLAPLGYEAKTLVNTLWNGVAAMVKNDGSCMNEEVFWKVFTRVYGEDSVKDRPIIDEFYREEFNQVQHACGFAKEAKETVELVKSLGKHPVLATNPIFPSIATENRMRWAGLMPEMFEFYTSYENSHYCKPNPKYYLELLEKLGYRPEECAMVGNDVSEDMIAETLGMKVFLLTDCLINKDQEDISRYPHGGFGELMEFLTTL